MEYNETELPPAPNEIETHGFDPPPAEDYPEFGKFENELFRAVKDNLRCPRIIEGQPCNRTGFKSHGKGGNENQGGFKTIQISCSVCPQKSRLNATLHDAGYFTLCKIYEKYYQYFLSKGIERKSGQRSITSFLQKTTLNDPIVSSDDAQAEPQDEEMDIIEDTTNDSKQGDLLRIIAELQNENKENRKIIQDLTKEVAILNQSIRDMQISNQKPPLYPASGNMAPNKKRAITAVANDTLSLPKITNVVTKILPRPKPESPTEAPAISTADTQPAKPDANSINEIKLQVDNLTQLVTQLINGKGTEKQTTTSDLSKEPTPAEAAKRSYAKVAATPAEIKKKRMAKKNQTRLIGLVQDKPAPATFTKVYIKIVKTELFKQHLNDPVETGVLITKILKALKIHRQVTAASKIGNSLLELYIPDAVLESVKKTLTESKVSLVKGVDVNSIPIFTKLPEKVIKQKLINRLAYLYGRYKYVNFRKTVLEGIDNDTASAVLALVRAKQEAKKLLLEAVVATDTNENDTIVDNVEDTVEDESNSMLVQQLPASIEPQGDDVEMVAPPSEC